MKWTNQLENQRSFQRDWDKVSLAMMQSVLVYQVKSGGITYSQIDLNNKILSSSGQILLQKITMNF